MTPTDNRQANPRSTPGELTPAGSNSLPDQRWDASTAEEPVSGREPAPTDNRQANWFSMPNKEMPAGSDSLPDHHQSATTASRCPSGREPTPPPASGPSTPIWEVPVVDPLLFVHVTAHGDLEQQRIASEHRLRILTTTAPDEDGVMRGFGLDESHPDVARLAVITEGLRRLEHDAELNLKRALRRCSIHPWVKAQVGLGEKQVARLLGAVGDPYWHLAEDRPRTVSELWAYSGLHVLPVSQQGCATRDERADGAQLPPTFRESTPNGHLSVGTRPVTPAMRVPIPIPRPPGSLPNAGRVSARTGRPRRRHARTCAPRRVSSRTGRRTALCI
jgi:hypothetical protein